MTDAERGTLSYEDFGRAARDLAQQVADSGFEPDVILSIARGGLFLGGALGYALDVKDLFVMSVEFYTGVDERLELPVVLPPTLDRLPVVDPATGPARRLRASAGGRGGSRRPGGGPRRR